MYSRLTGNNSSVRLIRINWIISAFFFFGSAEYNIKLWVLLIITVYFKQIFILQSKYIRKCILSTQQHKFYIHMYNILLVTHWS